jgi:hypothetical protein
VLTTTYTGSTEGRALDALRDLGAEVRVSYDTSTTRLHAKAWHFHRRSGFSTAYIGSSNLTHSAQVTGLEWNVRVSGARNPDVVEKMAAVFESCWNSGDFVPYDAETFAAQTESSARGPVVMMSPIEIRPEPFQERLLEEIELSRERGHHRNRLVSATGTGKTVMAAIDYARLREQLERSRLLFVAHREEILEQSVATFRHCLRDYAFGELWVGGRRPREFEHVFASIQSLNAVGLDLLDPAHFDVVIVDEFHHAAAPSYRMLLEHIRPVELLGLTATPERSDGLPLLDWFDHRIAAELRLWDAIDQQRLSPFVYYGVHDGLDLREVPWRRGRGYDVEGLSNLLTSNDLWARQVVAQVAKRVDDPRRMRALGFCVSVDHARFMARVFRDAGIPAVAVWGDSPDTERSSAEVGRTSRVRSSADSRSCRRAAIWNSIRWPHGWCWRISAPPFRRDGPRRLRNFAPSPAEMIGSRWGGFSRRQAWTSRTCTPGGSRSRTFAPMPVCLSRPPDRRKTSCERPAAACFISTTCGGSTPIAGS